MQLFSSTKANSDQDEKESIKSIFKLSSSTSTSSTLSSSSGEQYEHRTSSENSPKNSDIIAAGSVDCAAVAALVNHTDAKAAEATASEAEAAGAAAPSSSSSGKFGVGLSSCIMFAHCFFGDNNENFFEGKGICQVKTRFHSSTKSVIVLCTFGVDTSLGRIICLHRREIQNDYETESGNPLELTPFWGTEIRIIVPGGHAAQSASHRLQIYFERFHLTSHILKCDIM